MLPRWITALFRRPARSTRRPPAPRRYRARLEELEGRLVPAFIAVGADAGALPDVRVYDAASKTLIFDFLAFDPTFRGGVRVAVADVDGDRTPDIITAAGPGGAPIVAVYSGVDLHLIAAFDALDIRFADGLFVAAADIEHTGHADIIVGADAGGAPVVEQFSGITFTAVRAFYAYSPAFRGGVHVATGDINGDGTADIITGAGPGGGPHVEAFSGVDNSLLASFMAFDPTFRGGVYVATANFTPTLTPYSDIITGAGPGGAPEVRVWDGVSGALVRDFFADPSGALFFPDGAAFRAGVRVAAVETDASGRPELLVAFGAPHDSTIKVYDFVGLGVGLGLETQFLGLDPGWNAGIFIAGG